MKPSSRPRASRSVDAGLGVIAEAEVLALVHLGGVDAASSRTSAGEVAGGMWRELAVKGRTSVASIPVAARSSSLCGSGVMRVCGCSGRRTRAG